MRGLNLPQQKCKGALLMELAHEIKELKEELEESTYILLRVVRFIFANIFMEYFVIIIVFI